MNIEQLEEIISDLNEKMGEDLPLYGIDGFSIDSNGWYRVVKFNGKVIWNDSDDERDFIEEINDYEPLRPYLIKEAKRIVELLTLSIKEL